ncbi:hypothetical protein CPT_Pascal36 [Bacillus phage Pascal]|uniref:Uncharacterized protein n=1 Tax=Bacillus phage Pascal TaxID=1540092 RepID=A0A0A0RSZ3_9CAUD|nr:hypothetical protein CPT_Pascal36 [Bacillus phage Pascal]AIW03671.1 hypothetical protein CPT_Pascal36 [Bacillus phage Pascal]
MSFFTAEQKEIMKAKEILPSTVMYRMKTKKMTFEAAIATKEPLSREPRLHKVLSAEDIKVCVKKGIPRKILSKRACANWSREKIMNTPVKKKSFFSKRQLANIKRLGIHYQTAVSRVKYCHWTKERASSTPTGKNGVAHKN